MSNQPTALYLAQILQTEGCSVSDAAADELRRLHSVNADLLQAPRDATDAIEHWGTYSSEYFQQKWDLHSDINAARAAIARAEGKV